MQQARRRHFGLALLAAGIVLGWIDTVYYGWVFQPRYYGDPLAVAKHPVVWDAAIEYLCSPIGAALSIAPIIAMVLAYFMSR